MVWARVCQQKWDLVTSLGVSGTEDIKTACLDCLSPKLGFAWSRGLCQAGYRSTAERRLGGPRRRWAPGHLHPASSSSSFTGNNHPRLPLCDAFIQHKNLSLAPLLPPFSPDLRGGFAVCSRRQCSQQIGKNETFWEFPLHLCLGGGTQKTTSRVSLGRSWEDTGEAPPGGRIIGAASSDVFSTPSVASAGLCFCPVPDPCGAGWSRADSFSSSINPGL